MPVRSAGLLLVRRDDAGDLEVLIAHPGGPFWARKDDGAWSIPKGEYGDDEQPADAAAREFREELGLPVPEGRWHELGEVRQASGKRVLAWALEADLDPDSIAPGSFDLEWPPRSGRTQSFPEVDRVAWVDLATARRKLVTAQAQFIDRVAAVFAA